MENPSESAAQGKVSDSQETILRLPWRRALCLAVGVTGVGHQLADASFVGAVESPWRWLLLFRTHPARIGAAIAMAVLALHPWVFPRSNLSEGAWEDLEGAGGEGSSGAPGQVDPAPHGLGSAPKGSLWP